ncbi:hypothetical protein EMPG_12628 [Blastomyces silverae]|uniref:Protein kinase domain-containing protein n=1 Tax=Blastomyces silverae TaxID=2060906 RepID=A0A0H1BLD5_9EURO|nr:hypothetical protein EMPG_12628 [Blastomyces silverae]
MDGVSAAASLIALIETTIRLARATRAAAQSYANAETGYNELNNFGIQFSGLKLDLLLPSLETFKEKLKAREFNVNPRDLAAFEVVLRTTISTLNNASSYLHRHNPQGDRFARLKWALWIEAEATRNIALVEKRLDLLSRLLQDAALVSPQRALSSRQLRLQDGEKFIVSDGIYRTQANYKPRGPDDRLVLKGIDIFVQSCEQGKNSSRSQRIAGYCQALRGKDDSGSPFQTGFLPCIGFKNGRIVFLLPRNVDWKQHPASSLLACISNSEGQQLKPAIPLERRLDLATQLSEAVLKTHLSGFVHSAIRSETILFLGPPEDFKDEPPEDVAWNATPQNPGQEETVSKNKKANDTPEPKPGIFRRMSRIGSFNKSNNANGSQKLPATRDLAPKRQLSLRTKNSLGSLRRWKGGRENDIKNNENNKNNDDIHNGPQETGADEHVASPDNNHNNTTGDTNGLWDVGPGHGSVYLVGWWSMQAHAGIERMQEQDKGWHRAIYRHPDQWSENTLSHMGHDIYSLGVCLVEIAMWESLLVRKPGMEEEDGVGYGEGSFEPSELLVREAGFKDGRDLRRKGMRSREGQMKVKDALLKIAEEKLPALVGSGYTDVVRACLTCLDAGASGRHRKWDDGVELEQMDHDSVGKNCAAFKQVVLSRLWNLAAAFAA